MKPLLAILTMTPALLLASCSLFGDDHLSEIDRHRRQWQRLGIDTYEYDLTRSCFCPSVGTVRIHVRADTIYAVTVLNPEDAPHGEVFAGTIDALFDVVLEAAERADQLDVVYDDTFHYPARIDVDYIKEAIDDEVSYRAENLRPLRAP